ncbi:MAG: ATP-binding cassette domain-containing protein, partial [Proteobacteria bacterium]|nr:ATP-binding cassette domain-containing protein [Pseudomonadota bacterium]
MKPTLTVKSLKIGFVSGFSPPMLDFDVGVGVHHLKGPNGVGKTTLLRTLCGELQPLAGNITVCGLDPTSDYRARRHVAYLPASPEAPEFLTVDELWQNLAAIRGAPHWSGGALRERLGLASTLLLGQASSGQRRRAEFLAMLAGDPEVLLLDEVFTHLDAEFSTIVAELIENRRTSRLVLITSHQQLP